MQLISSHNETLLRQTLLKSPLAYCIIESLFTTNQLKNYTGTINIDQLYKSIFIYQRSTHKSVPSAYLLNYLWYHFVWNFVLHGVYNLTRSMLMPNERQLKISQRISQLLSLVTKVSTNCLTLPFQRFAYGWLQ